MPLAPDDHGVYGYGFASRGASTSTSWAAASTSSWERAPSRRPVTGMPLPPFAGPLPFVVGACGIHVYGEILGGLVSASGWANLSLRGPIPLYFEGSFGLRGCVAWVFCASRDHHVRVLSSRRLRALLRRRHGRGHPAGHLAGVAADGTTFVVLRWEVHRRAGRLPAVPLGARARSDSASVRSAGEHPSGSTICAQPRAIVTEGTPEWGDPANAARPPPRPVRSRRIGPCGGLRSRSHRRRSVPSIQAGVEATLTMGRIAGCSPTSITTCSPGRTYVYELRGVSADGSTQVLARDVQVVAGQFSLPAPSLRRGHAGRLPPRARAVEPQPQRRDLRRRARREPRWALLRVNPLPIAVRPGASARRNAADVPAAWLPRHRRRGTRTASRSRTSSPAWRSPVRIPAVTYHYRVASRGRPRSPRPVVVTASRPRPCARWHRWHPTRCRSRPTRPRPGSSCNGAPSPANVENHAFVHQGVHDTSQTYSVYRAETREAARGHRGAARPPRRDAVGQPAATSTTPVQEWHDTDAVLLAALRHEAFLLPDPGGGPFLIFSAPSAVIGARRPRHRPARPDRPCRATATPTTSASSGSPTGSPTSPATRSTVESATAATLRTGCRAEAG